MAPQVAGWRHSHTGAEVAERGLALCWTWARSWYAGSTWDKSGALGEMGKDTFIAVVAEWRQWMWQKIIQLEMEAADQPIWGLWSLSQGRPRTTAKEGEGIMNSCRHSQWLPGIVNVMGVMRWVMVAKRLPARAFTILGVLRVSMGMCVCSTKAESIKLSLAPLFQREWGIWLGVELADLQLVEALSLSRWITREMSCSREKLI